MLSNFCIKPQHLFQDPILKCIPSLSRDANSSARYLLNFLQQNFMSQYVSTPTRFNNIFDLVISDSDRLIHHTEVQQTNLSDHDLDSALLDSDGTFHISRLRAWQTSSSLNTPLSLATLMISTLRHRFSTPSYLSLSSTSPLPQPISRKLLRKSMRTPPVEISISLQKSFVNVEPTYPTPSTLSVRNLNQGKILSP